MSDVTSHGHKLGQMLGDFFQEIFSERFREIAQVTGLYLDTKGPRPNVRGDRRKVTWTDDKGNNHDMDYVFERNGSESKRGVPAAFVELLWRRYTKHSRNKAGEILGSLLPLKDTYKETCSFAGAIIGGEFTAGAIRQLESQGVRVLHIPYSAIVEAFKVKGLNLDYPEDASDLEKKKLVDALDKLSQNDIQDVKQALVSTIAPSYNRFIGSLRNALIRRVQNVRILGLFGEEMVFTSVSEAVKSVETYSMDSKERTKFQGFEIYVRFNNGDKVEGFFSERQRTLEFLRNLER